VHHVTSADGTSIAVQSRGEGPPVVLVVGAFNDRTSTDSLAAAMAPWATVHEYDRRGRGDSTDTPPYAVAREVEDLAAVVADVVTRSGQQPCGFGHSSGAALLLEAAAAGIGLLRVAVHEPPYNPLVTAGVADELTALAAAGDADATVAAFLALTGAPPSAVDGMRAGPAWAHMLSYAPTLAYDVRLCNDGVAPVDRLTAVTVPTLVTAGSESAPWAQPAADAVAGAVPHGEARVLAGQGHGVADDVLAPLLRDFFS
jgi:hypothetical protein